MGKKVYFDNMPMGLKKKDAPNPTNWQFSKHKACASQTAEKLPKKKSIKDKFGPVYYQHFGDCTANAVCGCDAYYYHKPPSTFIPSTVFTYYNSRKLDGCLKEPDDGSSVETALNAVRKFGVCNSTVWPNTTSYKKKPSKKAYEDGLKGHEITSYYQIKSLLQIKKALNSGYPVAVSVDWAFSYYDAQTYILNTPTKKEIEECESGHAMIIVGYDDTKELFEVRNSWSDQWANKGYAYIRYSTMKKVICFDDTYAVVK